MVSVFRELPNVLNDGLSTELMNAGRFCFSCEQIFSSRKCLEEHVCSVPSYICSCGTEFTSYNDMLLHSTSHEPGQQALDHETIKKRRIEKHWEVDEKLKRLQSGEVIWESPKQASAKAVVQMSMSPQMPHGQGQRRALPQITSNLNKNNSTLGTGKMGSDVGAPTVDLWTLFQPIVVVKTLRSFSKIRPYNCGKCGQSFTTKKSLVIHHSIHIADKVSGCIGCGLLLSSRKVVPRFHSCNSPHGNKSKLITARPINQITANMANGIAKIAPSFTPQSTQNNNGSYSKARIVTDVNYHPSTSKHPLKPIQIKPVVSNSKFVVVNTPAPPPPPAPAGVILTPGKGYECRVCHVYFESVNVLQRHKCAKAHEFLMKHKLSAPGNRQRSAAPLQVPSSSVKTMAKPILPPAPMSSTDRRLSNVTKNTSTAAADDDCFIVESGPEKPAEVIYQVTSSVPITT